MLSKWIKKLFVIDNSIEQLAKLWKFLKYSSWSCVWILPAYLSLPLSAHTKKRFYCTCSCRKLFPKWVDLCLLVCVIRKLKQTDAAAERRQSTSKFLFRKTQGQVNSVGPGHHSLLNWMEIWMWPPPLGRRVSLLKLPNAMLCYAFII